ncbi:MAG: type II toxin-antitoxin system VapC family toxin [Victivallaceae bacterium]|nr:type II toxin-antitoxin system VapC family toxin [Victivallaceae bacterium]
MSFLIDTCVISELRKFSPDPAVLKWFAAVDEEDLFISVLTFGEIEYGITILPSGRKQSAIMEWFEELKSHFKHQSIDVTPEVASRWGVMRGVMQRRGISASVVDGLIAATAIDRNFLLITRNVNDFKDTGARIFNPWES